MSIKKIDKKYILDLLIVLAITTFSLCFLFRNNIILGDDLTYHLNRFQGLANAFEERQILPKIYPYANYGYGYAAPLFYCDLFLYPFALLFHFGVSAVLCYKYCVFFYTLLGNLFVYFIFKKETNNRLLTLIAVVLYSCTNYHLQNIYVRAALGEILAMTFIPLVIHSIYKMLVKNENCWIYLGLSFSCLVMCHIISTFLYALFFLVMIIVYIVINRKDKENIKKTLITILKGTVLALFITAWYLLPMLEQLQSQTFWLTINAQYNDISSGTQSIKEVLTNVFALTNWKTFKIKDNASVGIVLLLLPLGNLLIKKKNKYITTICLYSIVLFLIILGVIPGEFLNITQFYFRLYIVIYPLLIIASVYFVANLNKQVIKNIVYVVICIYSIVNVTLACVQTKNGKYYLDNNATIYEINSINSFLYDLDYNHDELGGCEYLPYTERVKYETDTVIKFKDEYGTFVEYYPGYYASEGRKLFSTFEFDTEGVKEGTELLLPISYYKGYSSYILENGTWVKNDISYDEETKRLVVYAKEGSQTYKVVYTGTTIQKVSLIVSFVSIIGTTVIVIKNKKEELHA